jgi:choline-glycine betaine transporter
MFAPAGRQGGIPPEALMFILVAVGIGLLIGGLIAFFYYRTLYRCLARSAERNRRMTPWHVVFNIIPLFGIFWFYVTVKAIADTLADEYADRGWDEPGENYGRTVGMSMVVLNLISLPLSIAGQFEPMLGVINLPLSVVALVLFILYWVKMHGYASELGERPDDDYDDEDDRPRRRRDEDDDYDR